MMLLVRILAQLVDWIVGVLSLIVTFAYILPFLSRYIKNDVWLGIAGLIIVVLLILAIQYPFMKNQQTLGKGFFALKIVSTEKTREEVTVGVIFQREILCKLASCYFICLPMIFRKAGGHEEATRTKIVKAEKQARRKNIG